jgi:glycosyltransferase involved in cell wall biosynthesis
MLKLEPLNRGERSMRTDPPAVSVVVPSFNQGRFIGEAIDSILSQAYPNLEILVMDGGSTDETLELLATYGDRIRFWSERDEGQADALNHGFERAEGVILGWLNSDDRYCPGAIAKAVAALEAEPEAGFVYGEGELIAEDGRVLCRFPGTQPFDLWTLARVSDFIMQPTVFMRAEALREVGSLDTSLHYGMDWDLWIRMASRRPVVYLPELLAQTREYPAAKTATGGFKRWRELRSILNRYGAGRWPPAAVTYGLDTLRRKWPVVFGPSSAGDIEALKNRPVSWVFKPIHRLVTLWIDRVLRNAQGISIDRWTARRSRLAIPWSGQDAVLSVKGEVPAPPEHFPLEIEVMASGESRVIRVMEWGGFEARLDLPADGSGPRPLEIQMRTSHTFRADNDPRRLAFRIGEARLEDVGRTWVVRPHLNDTASRRP